MRIGKDREHTPGPWTYFETDGGFYVDGAEPGIRPLAQRIENVTDARLIAASPVMLAALRLCLSYMTDTKASDVSGEKALDAIRAAILRATEGE